MKNGINKKKKKLLTEKLKNSSFALQLNRFNEFQSHHIEFVSKFLRKKDCEPKENFPESVYICLLKMKNYISRKEIFQFQ